MITDSKTLKKWEALGFLYEVSDDYLKWKTCQYFEMSADYMLNLEGELDSMTEGIIFPVIRRLVGEHNMNIDVHELVFDIDDFVSENFKTRDLNGPSGGINLEAEAIKLFCDIKTEA